MRTRLALGLTLLALQIVVPAASAHVFQITDVIAVLKTDGDLWVDITADVDALLLGVSPATPSDQVAAQIRGLPEAEFDAAVAQLREMIVRRVRIRFDDGEPAALQVTFPEHESGLADRPGLPSVLGIVIRLHVRTPPEAGSVTFAFSRAFNATRFTLIEQPTTRVLALPLAPGQESPSFALRSASSQPAGSQPVVLELDRRDVIGRYLVLGFEHILPKGLDHILFVLGLFLLSTRLGPLLWQVTAFTAAHTLTLALAVSGVFDLPSHVVEPLIAASIAYVAIENMITSELKPWRPVVVFLFGLLHGLGFAGVLSELGLPAGELAAALLAFNVGVELGQLAVIVLALLLVGWARKKSFYRRVIVLPASGAIAAMGLYWAVQRVLVP